MMAIATEYIIVICSTVVIFFTFNIYVNPVADNYVIFLVLLYSASIFLH